MFPKDGDTDLYTKRRYSSALGDWVPGGVWKPQFPARVPVPAPPVPVPQSGSGFTAFKHELRNALAALRPGRSQADAAAPAPAPVLPERTESMTLIEDARREGRVWAERMNGTPKPAPAFERERGGFSMNVGMFLPLQRPTIERAYAEAEAYIAPAGSPLAEAEAERAALPEQIRAAYEQQRDYMTDLLEVKTRLVRLEADVDADPMQIASDRIRCEQLERKKVSAETQRLKLEQQYAAHPAIAMRQEYTHAYAQLAALSDLEDFYTSQMTVASARDYANQWRATIKRLTGETFEPIAWMV